MSSKPSKTALKVQAKAEFLAASKRTYQEQVTAGLIAHYAGILSEDEPMPDWDHVQDLQVRTLESVSAEVAATDLARREALTDRKNSFAKGRQLARANHLDLRSLRDRFTAVYGP